MQTPIRSLGGVWRALPWWTSLAVITALLATFARLHPSHAAEFACTEGDVACLIETMRVANANGEANAITLAMGTYRLTAVDNDTDGQYGLPSITSALTLRGQGAQSTVIERAASAPPFRLLHVEATGVLTMEGFTLQGVLFQTCRTAASITRVP